MRTLTIIAVFEDGSVPTDGSDPLVPYEQNLDAPRYTDLQIDIEGINQDGTPHDIAGGAFILSAKVRPTDATAALSVEATNDNDELGLAHGIAGSNNNGIAVLAYGYILIFTDADGRIWPCVAQGTYSITPSEYVPGQPVDQDDPQAPLGQGPPGNTPVRALAEVNLDLSGIPDSADTDDVTLEPGQLAFLTGQDNETENGPWAVSDTDWSRPVVFRAGNSAAARMFGVTNGTDHHGQTWICTSLGGVDVVGTDALAFSQLVGTGGGTVDSIVAGAGIDVDNTDPRNPIVSASDLGTVTSVTDDGSDHLVTVDNTDPQNPQVVSPAPGADHEVMVCVNGIWIRRQLTANDIAAAFAITDYEAGFTREIGYPVTNPGFDIATNQAMKAAITVTDEIGTLPLPSLIDLLSGGFVYDGNTDLPARTYVKTIPGAQVPWVFVAHNAGGILVTGALYATWTAPTFYGSAVVGTIDEAFIHALPGSQQKTNGNIVAFFPNPDAAGRKIYIAYPAGYGYVPSSVKDQNGFDFAMVQATAIDAPVQVTNGAPAPVTTDYYILESLNFINDADFTLTVTF